MDYNQFFLQATEKQPFPYQKALAEKPTLPGIVLAPTGAGKTAAVIVGWLWRRVVGDTEMSREVPRRLIYCLPMRVLVEQTSDNASKWVKRLGLGKRVGVHVLMGGEDTGEWDLQPESEAMIIGTQDMLLSRALNRGYGMSRYRWPMHFGLLNNDCLWVFDEVQLMGSGLATSTQLEAFRGVFGSMAPCKSIWMSATLKTEWLQTIDFRKQAEPLTAAEISDADRSEVPLQKRLNARKRLHLCQAANSEDFKPLADSVLKAHRRNSLTLVVMNTVDRAVSLYKALNELSERNADEHKSEAIHHSKTGQLARPELLLIHSRFRPLEKNGKIERLLGEIPPGGLIAITTQVIEAGVDVSARTLFTELAPWASLVQRFGRCNRYGEYEDAEIFWIDVFKPRVVETKDRKEKLKDVDPEEAAQPYTLEELEAARRQLKKLSDVSPVSLEKHLQSLDEQTQADLFPYSPVHVIRKKDLLELFDTTPDLAGNDIDVSRFIRDSEDLDAQVFWRNNVLEDARPQRVELCPVPCNKLREFSRKQKKDVCCWDALSESWDKVGPEELYPGKTYLIPADQGGYDPDCGWDPESKDEVEPVSLDTILARSEANDRDDEAKSSIWLRISEHTERVVATLEGLITGLGLALDENTLHALIIAARWHDRGKAHSVFQEALEGDNGRPEGGDWGKAPRIKRYNQKGFRHELASALAMIQAGKPDLACYLAAAHHGKVRLSIRSLPTEKPPENHEKRFARGIEDGDRLPPTDLGGHEIAGAVTLSLEPMELGLSADGKPSWAERILKLRDDPELGLGPFRLAFLEALLRVADIRASKIQTIEPKQKEVCDA